MALKKLPKDWFFKLLKMTREWALSRQPASENQVESVD